MSPATAWAGERCLARCMVTSRCEMRGVASPSLRAGARARISAARRRTAARDRGRRVALAVPRPRGHAPPPTLRAERARRIARARAGGALARAGGSPCRRPSPSATPLSMGTAAPERLGPAPRRDRARRPRRLRALLRPPRRRSSTRSRCRILRERGEAEEVVQDVFMQVWRQAESYSTDRGTPEAWLITMTRSRGIDKLRSRRRRDEMVRPADNPDRLPEPAVAESAAGPGGGARDARRGSGGPAGGAAERPRARVLRRPHAERDRRASRRAARDGEDAHAQRARAAPGRARSRAARRNGHESRREARAGGRRLRAGRARRRGAGRVRGASRHGLRDLRGAAPRDPGGARGHAGGAAAGAAAAGAPGSRPRADRRRAPGDARARRAPAGAAAGPRPLVGGVGGARRGGRAPRRRQHAAVEDAGGDPGAAGPGVDAPGRARRARADARVPVRSRTCAT